MALADKKYERLFSTTGSDADKIDNDKFTKIKAKFDNNEYLEDEDNFETLAPVLYQIQKMQDELDEIRRHVVNDVVGTQGPKGDTGSAGAAGAKEFLKFINIIIIIIIIIIITIIISSVDQE